MRNRILTAPLNRRALAGRLLAATLALAALAAAAKDPQPATGPMTRVTLTSQPAGAKILVDGDERGVTPITLLDLAPGRHRFTCSHPGFITRERYLAVEDGAPIERNISLDPVRGLLLVRSIPDGAAVEIDGVTLGQTPRLVTTLIASEPHKVKLSKPGFVPTEFDVKFDGRRPFIQTVKLLSDTGAIEVATEPAGASVTINGIARGRTPLTVLDIPKGDATVEITLDGFVKETRALKVTASKTEALKLTLAALPGTLSVVSVPEAARVYLNGTFKGKTPLVIRDLTPGQYGLRVEHDDCLTATREIELTNGAQPTEEFKLENNLGRLEVRTAPSDAEVWIDGKMVGTTPDGGDEAGFSGVLTVERLRAGEHAVILKAKGFADQSFKREIKAGKTSTIKRTLKRVLVPDVVIVKNSGERIKGRLIRQTDDNVVIEEKLGMERSFPRQDVRVVPIDLLK